MKAGILTRVSDPGIQTGENQLAPLQAEAERRGYNVVKTYEIGVSAWKGAHQKVLTEVFNDARMGLFQVLMVWALDRLSREGALATLEIWHRLSNMGVTVVSLQEPWVEASSDFKDVLLAITGWVARMGSQRRSERTRAGLERAISEGKRLGRPTGAKDKRKRRRGYREVLGVTLVPRHCTVGGYSPPPSPTITRCLSLTNFSEGRIMSPEVLVDAVQVFWGRNHPCSESTSQRILPKIGGPDHRRAKLRGAWRGRIGRLLIVRGMHLRPIPILLSRKGRYDARDNRKPNREPET